MKHFIIFLSILLSGHTLLAQNTHFTVGGTVEFEKTINMFALLKKKITKENESWMQSNLDNYKRYNPQFKKLKSVLTFTKDKSIFKPIIPEATPQNYYGNDPAADQFNTIYTDLVTNTSVTQKKVFEELFLVKDSTRRITWKLTDETKDIAGYTCRRANALVMDSVYVVAFYSEEIPVSSGPESFTGLPGMILGVALPHENITWFATKVTDLTIEPSAIAAPAKGKATDNKKLKETLVKVMKDNDEENEAGKSLLRLLLL